MIFKTEKRLLNVVSEAFASDTNEVYVCKDMGQPGKTYYTVILIKQHQIAGQLIKAFEKNESEKSLDLEYFSVQGHIGLVLPYEKERPLTEFYMGSRFSVTKCEEICTNLVLQCITSKLPPQLLYLILSQNSINIQRDNSLSFSYLLDLNQYDDKKTRQDCIKQCAEIIVKLLEPCHGKKAKSYDLIRKKTYKNGYTDFTELYKDIVLTATAEKKPGIREIWKNFREEKKDTLFRLLLIVCIILILLTLIMLLSQLIFGEVKLFRLFSNPLKKIGTEILT